MRLNSFLLVLLLPAILPAQDPREIVRRSVSHDNTNWLLARDYTWQERTEERELDSEGRLQSRESKTHDVIIIGGSPYKKLVARNDQPLSAQDNTREERRFEDAVEKGRKKEAERTAEKTKERERERQFLQAIPKAYDFTLLGEEKVDGRDAWKIQVEPKRNYSPPNGRARLLTKMRGVLWVEKATFFWCRAEAEIVEPLSFGVFLIRLDKGATASLELRRINDEVWLPQRLRFQGSARVALVKRIRADTEITYTNYRKFQSSSEVIPNPDSTTDH